MKILEIGSYEKLRDSIYSHDLDEDQTSIYLNYSGRGMYGQTCFGLYGSFGIATATSIILKAFETELAQEIISSTATDNLGRGMIYYYPGFNFDVDDLDEQIEIY